MTRPLQKVTMWHKAVGENNYTCSCGNQVYDPRKGYIGCHEVPSTYYRYIYCDQCGKTVGKAKTIQVK